MKEIVMKPASPKESKRAASPKLDLLGREKFGHRLTQKLSVVEVPYMGFDGRTYRGKLVVDRDLAGEVQAIFAELLQNGFPIASIQPIAVFNWDDHLSMAANNTSAFNYRLIDGTARLSNHATGRAIDLNPLQNPLVSLAEAKSHRPGRGKITSGDATVLAFKRRGWKWGGDWKSKKDFQHFEKP